MTQLPKNNATRRSYRRPLGSALGVRRRVSILEIKLDSRLRGSERVLEER